MCFAINAYLGDLHCCCLDPAVPLGTPVVSSWLGACLFLRPWVYLPAGKLCGCSRDRCSPFWAGSGYRVWFQRRFIRRLYVVLTSFLLLLLPGTWLPLVPACCLPAAASCCCAAAWLEWRMLLQLKQQEWQQDHVETTSIIEWAPEWLRWQAGKPFRHDLGVTFGNSGDDGGSPVGMT